MALRLDEAGADGLVLFNRFVQPDIDPETLTVARTPSLSTPAECRLPLTWIALLHGRVGASLAASTGVESCHRPDQVPAGRRGRGDDRVGAAAPRRRATPRYCSTDCVNGWGARDSTSVEELRGMLAVPVGVDETARERADYVSALQGANQRRIRPLVTG